MLHAHGSKLGYDEVEASGELCQAAKDSNLPLLQLLLDCACSVNAANYDQRTCLHLAASVGNLQITQLLLDKGAYINAKDR